VEQQQRKRAGPLRIRAFSSEVDTGSREENASKQEIRASVLIQSEPILLWYEGWSNANQSAEESVHARGVAADRTRS
jgi:hypothetical protein